MIPSRNISLKYVSNNISNVFWSISVPSKRDICSCALFLNNRPESDQGRCYVVLYFIHGDTELSLPQTSSGGEVDQFPCRL